MTTDPKKIVHQYFNRLLNQRDLRVCDELLSPEYIDHDAGPQATPGPEQTKAWVADFLARHTKMQVKIEDLFAEKQKVAARITWNGVEADTGEEFHREGIVIIHLDEKSRIAERWSAYL